jgi:hypothetical protein
MVAFVPPYFLPLQNAGMALATSTVKQHLCLSALVAYCVSLAPEVSQK